MKDKEANPQNEKGFVEKNLERFVIAGGMAALPFYGQLFVPLLSTAAVGYLIQGAGSLIQKSDNQNLKTLGSAIQFFGEKVTQGSVIMLSAPIYLPSIVANIVTGGKYGYTDWLSEKIKKVATPFSYKEKQEAIEEQEKENQRKQQEQQQQNLQRQRAQSAESPPAPSISTTIETYSNLIRNSDVTYDQAITTYKALPQDNFFKTDQRDSNSDKNTISFSHPTNNKKVTYELDNDGNIKSISMDAGLDCILPPLKSKDGNTLCCFEIKDGKIIDQKTGKEADQHKINSLGITIATELTAESLANRQTRSESLKNFKTASNNIARSNSASSNTSEYEFQSIPSRSKSRSGSSSQML